MDPTAGWFVDHEPALALGDESPIEIRARQRTLVFRPQLASDLETDSRLGREGFIRQREDSSGLRDPANLQEMTYTRSRDSELIREEAIEPLPPAIGFDLDDR